MVFAFVKRVCVGEGWTVVTIDKAGGGANPVKLWCLFARASEVTNFPPPGACSDQIR